MSSKPITLMNLPREIREEIFSYLLISHTGMIEYSAKFNACNEGCVTQPLRITFTNAEETWPLLNELRYKLLGSFADVRKSLDHFSLILTCRQLNQECKEIMCSKNNLLYKSNWEPIRNREASALRDIQHITVCGTVVYEDREIFRDECLKTAMSNCETLSRVKTLRQITLFLRLGTVLDMRSFKDSIAYKQSIEEGMTLRSCHRSQIGIDYCKSVLQKMENLKRCLSQSHVKMVIRTSSTQYSPSSTRYTMECASKANGLMRELHESTGAEFWIDERLCYKDGVEIDKPYRFPPLSSKSKYLGMY